MSTDTRGVTPYRRTHIRFDVAENTLREPAFFLSRSAHQIAQGHAGDRLSQNWRYLESGAIAIAPWQDDLSNLHQKTDTPGAIIPLSDFDAVAGVKERNTWRKPTDLMGVVVDPSLADTGDPFLQNTVAAGTTWATSHAADMNSFGNIRPSGANVAHNRLVIGKKEQFDNQGFTVRFVMPAFAPHHKQSVGVYYFGGPISDQIDGTIPTGVYALELTGWGSLYLWMRVGNGDGTFSFARIDAWPAYTQNTAAVINVQIWPHYTANGVPCIYFRSDAGGQSPAAGSLFSPLFAGRTNPQVHIWYGWAANPSLPVTGHGPVRVDVPQDLRPPFQISIHKHIEPAYIWDDPFAFDFFPTTLSPVTLVWQCRTPGDSSVLGGLYDLATGAALTSIASGPNWVTYNLNPGHYYYNAKFTLTPPTGGNTSPMLYGYKVTRPAIYGALAPGEFSIPDTYPLAGLRQVSISGPDKDLTHETASATIEDPAANLSRINIRARVRTRIETEYDPLDSSLRSVLFDGFCDRADGKLKGTDAYEGLAPSVSTRRVRAYPSPAWKQFACTFSGVWRRLREKLTMQRIDLGKGVPGDIDDKGNQRPFKVTDVCRGMLSWCGFSDAEIDVPDSGIYFYPGTDGGSDETTVEPLAEIGDVVAGFLHDFLGWFLVWDGNAGANGMIRAIRPPPLPGPYNPLANFTLDLPAAGRLTYRPESYGSKGWYATGAGDDVVIPTCFIRKRTFQTHVKPPEANAVHVTATGLLLPNKGGQYQLNQWAWNPKSYDFFVDGGGSPIHTADPNDPDFLGEFIPLVVVNTSLPDQHTVDILTRRLYDAACRAQKWAQFEAPLALVIDKNDARQSKLRPLRYYDPVYLTRGGFSTTWLVRSCNPFFRKDGQQWAHYELLAVPS